MDTSQPIDHVESIDWDQFPEIAADPRDRLFADLSRGPDVRLLAIAEPVGASGDYVAAETAIRAFQSAVAWSREEHPERLLKIGIAAAHKAVSDLNADVGSNVRLRRFVGLTAAVIAPGSLTVGIVPPGLMALLLPGREPVVLSGGDGVPLGSSGSVNPAMTRLTLHGDERIALAWSNAESALKTWIDEGSPDEARLIELAEETGGGDVVVSVVDVAGVTSAAGDNADWSGWGSSSDQDGGDAGIDAALLRNPRFRRAVMIDRWRNRAIDWAERHFAEADYDNELVSGRLRFSGAASIKSVNPYTNTNVKRIAHAALPFMPRGVGIPVWVRVATLVLLVVLVVGGVAYGVDGRQARAERQDRAISDARTAIQAGLVAETTAGAQESFAVAAAAIERARTDGAPESLLVQIDGELISAMDTRLGNRRLSGWQRLGTLPSSIANLKPSLVMAGEELFMIANGVYKVSRDGQGISPSLRAGQVVDGLAVGNITCGTTDGEDLIAVDGSSAFRWSRGRWSATLLPPTPSGGTWSARACGTFDGNLYILDDRYGTIVKFVLRNFSEPPLFWVKESDISAVAGATEMFIDGSIHLLLQNGVLQTFHLGAATEQRQIAGRGEVSQAIATFYVNGSDAIYVAEALDGSVQIRVMNRTSAQESVYAQPDQGQPGFDAPAAKAMNGVIDFAIDEKAGVIYFIGDGGLWSATIPTVPTA